MHTYDVEVIYHDGRIVETRAAVTAIDDCAALAAVVAARRLQCADIRVCPGGRMAILPTRTVYVFLATEG